MHADEAHWALMEFDFDGILPDREVIDLIVQRRNCLIATADCYTKLIEAYESAEHVRATKVQKDLEHEESRMDSRFQG